MVARRIRKVPRMTPRNPIHEESGARSRGTAKDRIRIPMNIRRN